MPSNDLAVAEFRIENSKEMIHKAMQIAKHEQLKEKQKIANERHNEIVIMSKIENTIKDYKYRYIHNLCTFDQLLEGLTETLPIIDWENIFLSNKKEIKND